MAVRVDRFQVSKQKDEDLEDVSLQDVPLYSHLQRMTTPSKKTLSTSQLYSQQLATMVDIRWKCISFVCRQPTSFINSFCKTLEKLLSP